MLRSDILDLLACARGLGLKGVGLLSNGITVRRDFGKLEPFLRDGTAVPVLSLDSLRPELHNYVRDDARAWENSIEALKALADLRKEASGVKFSVISIVFERNLEELEDLYVFARELGAANPGGAYELRPIHMYVPGAPVSDAYTSEREYAGDKAAGQKVDAK